MKYFAVVYSENNSYLGRVEIYLYIFIIYLTALSISQIIYFPFFSNLPNPSGHTMALGLTQPLTEMSTRNLKKKKKTWG
jgi:hypothetical protein